MLVVVRPGVIAALHKELKSQTESEQMNNETTPCNVNYICEWRQCDTEERGTFSFLV